MGALDANSSGVEGGLDAWLVWSGCIVGIGGKSGKLFVRRTPAEGHRVAVSEMVGWGGERNAELFDDMLITSIHGFVRLHLPGF